MAETPTPTELRDHFRDTWVDSNRSFYTTFQISKSTFYQFLQNPRDGKAYEGMLVWYSENQQVDGEAEAKWDAGLMDVVIYQPPLNSSGDIYHILAARAVCPEAIKSLILTYDTEDTKEQVNRMRRFSRSCFESVDWIQTVRLRDGSGYRYLPRRAKTLKELEKRLGDVYADAKFTTTLLARYFMNGGGVEPIQTIFQTAASNLEDDRVGKWLQKIKGLVAKRPNKRLVIIHTRVSNTANAQQSDSTIQLNSIAARLQGDCVVVQILATSLARMNGITNCDYTIRPFAQAGLAGDGDGKLLHAKLLLELQKNKLELRLVGVIGNTSGTLDVAALIGLPTLCIHRLANSSVRHAQYQDMRMFLQVTFLSAILVHADSTFEFPYMTAVQMWMEAPNNCRCFWLDHVKEVFLKQLDRKESVSLSDLFNVGAERWEHVDAILKHLHEKATVLKQRKRR